MFPGLRRRGLPCTRLDVNQIRLRPPQRDHCAAYAISYRISRDAAQFGSNHGTRHHAQVQKTPPLHATAKRLNIHYGRLFPDSERRQAGIRFVELGNNLEQLRAQAAQLDQQKSVLQGTMSQMEGAQHEVSYWRKNWLTLPAKED